MKKNNLEQLIAKGYDFDIEHSYRSGWEMFKAKTLYSMAYAPLIPSIQFLFALYITVIAFVFSVILARYLYAGFFVVANKISINEQPVYGNFFNGFQYKLPLMIVWVV